MRVILRLTTDSGEEITSLVLPVTQQEYLTVSAEALAQQYITPYLESLRTDGFVWERICRMGAGVTRNEYGPV